jgi:hypothetical protein
MQSNTLKGVALCPLFAALSFAVQASAQNQGFTTFDPPGSVATLPFSINVVGAVTGRYLDANFQDHGFVRAASGVISTFDPRGSIDTEPESINTLGAVTGLYTDSNSVGHGFLRTAGGAITTFNAPAFLLAPNRGA